MEKEKILNAVYPQSYPQVIHNSIFIYPHDPYLSTKIIKVIHKLSTKIRVIHNVIMTYPQDNFFRKESRFFIEKIFPMI